MIKGKKGITLIALVITIIVLLILAGITIATLTGENGILTKTNEAKIKTTEGEERDQLTIAYDAAMAGNYKNEKYEGEVTQEQLQKELDNQGANAIVTKSGSLKVTFNNSGNVYTIDEETGKINKKFNENTYTGLDNSEPTNTDKYGYKVNGYNVKYSYDTNLDKTSNVWRLFYQDKKYTYLISDECIGMYKPSNYYEKNDKYSEGTKISKVGEKLNERAKALFTKEETKSNPNIRATVWFTDISDDSEWSKYKNEDAIFAIGSPTSELFEKSYNNNTNTSHEPYKNSLIAMILETYGYRDNNIDGRLIPNDSNGIYNVGSKFSWWLASPANNEACGLLVYGGPNRIDYHAVTNPGSVCPIVCMPTSVFNTGNKYTLVNE